MDHSRNCIFAPYNNLMTHFLSFHMCERHKFVFKSSVCIAWDILVLHRCNSDHILPHCISDYMFERYTVVHNDYQRGIAHHISFVLPHCMFAHLNQNLMNNFSLGYIHERGTFDCMTDAFHLAYSHSTFARHAPLLHSVMTHCHRAQK